MKARARALALACAAMGALGPAAAASAGELAGVVAEETATGAALDLAALAERLAAGADLVVLGEIHDNPLHHAIQADLVARLAAAEGGVAGLAFEMIAEADEPKAAEIRGRALAPAAEAAALADALDWATSGWPDFAYYAPILAAAPGAAVAGAQPPREELMRYAEIGVAASVDAAKFGLDRPLAPEDRAAREAEQIAAHCDALPAEMAPMLVAAQRYRDARFAAALLRARAMGGGGRAVLITGTGHARRDIGVPAALAIAAPELRVIAVGLLEDDDAPATANGADGAATALAAPPFDFLIVTPSRAALRDDPCAAFHKG